MKHSLGLHAVVLLIVIFGLPHFADEHIIMAPVPVEIVTEADISAAPKAPPTPEPPKPQPPPKPEPPKPQLPEPTPPPPAPDEVPLPSPEPPKPQPKQPPKPPKPTKPKPQPPKKVEKKPPPKKTTDFSSLLDNLSKEPVKDEPAATPSAPTEAPSITTALNPSEMDAVRNQVMGCWFEPTGLKEGQQLLVELRVTVNQDRTVAKAEVVDKNRMRSDPFYRTLGESAVRALYNPKCSPLLLPPDKYSTWRVTTFRFSPGGLY